MAIFADRTAAGRELAESLTQWHGADAVVFGIPRGGIVVAAEVARQLGLPLDVAVVRKLGAPSHEEFAVGAIAEGVRVVNPDAVRAGGVSPEQLSIVEDLERIELNRRLRAFPRTGAAIAGRIAIVVDDGVATGATASAACQALHAESPERMVLAVPVAPETWVADAAVVDEFVCPHRMRDFWAVGQYYDDFTQTTDEEVARLLARASTGSATEQGSP
ncbi:phosphoribosyltransferase [Microbacterium pumilum]|uniref:Phosphoribosyltransferase domain-containing protein n=1 Tax=Microbacterium pumilum TaxID=344165 RepID=A0ABP5E1F2_9MICO